MSSFTSDRTQQLDERIILLFPDSSWDNLRVIAAEISPDKTQAEVLLEMLARQVWAFYEEGSMFLVMRNITLQGDIVTLPRGDYGFQVQDVVATQQTVVTKAFRLGLKVESDWEIVTSQRGLPFPTTRGALKLLESVILDEDERPSIRPTNLSWSEPQNDITESSTLNMATVESSAPDLQTSVAPVLPEYPTVQVPLSETTTIDEKAASELPMEDNPFINIAEILKFSEPQPEVVVQPVEDIDKPSEEQPESISVASEAQPVTASTDSEPAVEGDQSVLAVDENPFINIAEILKFVEPQPESPVHSGVVDPEPIHALSESDGSVSKEKEHENTFNSDEAAETVNPTPVEEDSSFINISEFIKFDTPLQHEPAVTEVAVQFDEDNVTAMIPGNNTIGEESPVVASSNNDHPIAATDVPLPTETEDAPEVLVAAAEGVFDQIKASASAQEEKEEDRQSQIDLWIAMAKKQAQQSAEVQPEIVEVKEQPAPISIPEEIDVQPVLQPDAPFGVETEQPEQGQTVDVIEQTPVQSGDDTNSPDVAPIGDDMAFPAEYSFEQPGEATMSPETLEDQPMAAPVESAIDRNETVTADFESETGEVEPIYPFESLTNSSILEGDSKQEQAEKNDLGLLPTPPNYELLFDLNSPNEPVQDETLPHESQLIKASTPTTHDLDWWFSSDSTTPESSEQNSGTVRVQGEENHGGTSASPDVIADSSPVLEETIPAVTTEGSSISKFPRVSEYLEGWGLDLFKKLRTWESDSEKNHGWMDLCEIIPLRLLWFLPDQKRAKEMWEQIAERKNVRTVLFADDAVLAKEDGSVSLRFRELWKERYRKSRVNLESESTRLRILRSNIEQIEKSFQEYAGYQEELLRLGAQEEVIPAVQTGTAPSVAQPRQDLMNLLIQMETVEEQLRKGVQTSKDMVVMIKSGYMKLQETYLRLLDQVAEKEKRSSAQPVPMPSTPQTATALNNNPARDRSRNHLNEQIRAIDRFIQDSYGGYFQSDPLWTYFTNKDIFGLSQTLVFRERAMASHLKTLSNWQMMMESDSHLLEPQIWVGTCGNLQLFENHNYFPHIILSSLENNTNLTSLNTHAWIVGRPDSDSWVLSAGGVTPPDDPMLLLSILNEQDENRGLAKVVWDERELTGERGVGHGV